MIGAAVAMFGAVVAMAGLPPIGSAAVGPGIGNWRAAGAVAGVEAGATPDTAVGVLAVPLAGAGPLVVGIEILGAGAIIVRMKASPPREPAVSFGVPHEPQNLASAAIVAPHF